MAKFDIKSICKFIKNNQFYGKSKLECEKILKEYNKKKVNCFVFRLPGVVGKYSHSNFITELVNDIG